jgi:ubiquinone biosynthesis protein
MRTLYGSGKPDLELIERLGLLAVKIGQVYALRPDFLSDEKCRELAKLYRHTSYPTADENAEVLLEKVAPGLRAQLETFESKPFASASIGQVHRATLLDGEDVAVKLVKARFSETFRHDVEGVKRLFRFATFLYPKLAGVANPVGLIAAIEKSTLSELDLRNEIAGYRTLRDIYEHNKARFDLGHLGFVRIHEELSGENVLVSEYLPGPTLDELLDRRELGYESLLELFHIHGFFMFGIGTFHGDIHPGNIILQDGTFYFLDTGYIGQVNDKIRVNLFHFFDALSQWDYVQCAHFLHAMSEKQIDATVYASFEKKFLELYKDFKDASVSQVSLTKRMMETIRLGVLSGMEFSEGMFDIIKSLMYLDGMVLRCNPDAVLLRDMRPFVNEYRNFVK